MDSRCAYLLLVITWTSVINAKDILEEINRDYRTRWVSCFLKDEYFFTLMKMHRQYHAS